MSLGVRHIAERSKSGKQRRRRMSERVPERRTHRFKETLDLLIYPVAVAAPLALVPQVFQLYSTQDATGLALPTWILLGLVNGAWLLYGYVHREHPIVISSAAFVFLHFSIVYGILMFR